MFLSQVDEYQKCREQLSKMQGIDPTTVDELNESIDSYSVFNRAQIEVD